MATEEVKEIVQTLHDLRKSHLEVLLKLETLEERLETGRLDEVRNSLEFLQRDLPCAPEPILNCVQCGEDYRESKNAEGSCHYHSKPCQYQHFGYQFECCEQQTKDEAMAIRIPGCTRGKHSSQHHRDFFYNRYPLYVMKQVEHAKQVWMEAELLDVLSNKRKWAEVGISEDDRLYMAGGTSKTAENVCIVKYTTDELQELKEDTVIFSEKDKIGRRVTVEALTSVRVVKAIRVTLEAAHTKVPLVKELGIDYDDGRNPLCGMVKCTSDPDDRSSLPQYKAPDEFYEGHRLNADEDFHKDRKNDYDPEITNSMPVTMKQYGHTDVTSTRLPINGKWENTFSCKIKVINSQPKELIITNVKGYYQNHEKEWVECDELRVGKDILGKTAWFEESMFFLDHGSCVVSISLSLKFEGPPPPSELGQRAYHTLPQPLHLKVVLVGQDGQEASLRFEQGNKSLKLQTQESCTKQVCKDPSRCLFWECVDDVRHLQRRDVIIFRNGDDGRLMYRPSIGSTTYTLHKDILSLYAYKAKTMGRSEYEISEWKKEDRDGFSIIPYAVVDLTHVVTYALKVVLKSSTSKNTAYFLIPEDVPCGSLTVMPKQVPMKGVLNVQWKVPQAFASDSIEVFLHHGKTNINHVSMKNQPSEGQMALTAPLLSGDYEVRYYRRQGRKLCIASKVFTVFDMNL